MPTRDFPSSVPVCTSKDEVDTERRNATEDDRPFVAVIDVDGTPGWKAAYSMEEAGDSQEEWYLLEEKAVADLAERHGEFQQAAEQYSFNDGCSHRSGSLHGLGEEDARELAEQFAEIVWDPDNWTQHNPEEVYLFS
jgi:hypothetical protein